MRLTDAQKKANVQAFVKMRAGAKAWLKEQCVRAYRRGYNDAVSGGEHRDLYRYLTPEIGAEASRHYQQGWLDAGESF